MTSMPHSVTVSTEDFDSSSEGSNPSAVAKSYLIAHKVRGQIAFDIAEQMPVGDEIFWIISSVGHRAYPFWYVPLDKISYQVDGEGMFDLWLRGPDQIPDNLQDFWAVTTPTIEPKITKKDQAAGRQLLLNLGLSKPQTHNAVEGEFKRRI